MGILLDSTCLEHSVRKSTSSSILLVQVVQKRRLGGIGGRECLPVSIPRWCELSLSLQSEVLYLATSYYIIQVVRDLIECVLAYHLLLDYWA